MRELTYVSPGDPPFKRWAVSAIEDLAGRRKFLPLYKRWREESAGKSSYMMGEMLDLIDVKIDINANGRWPIQVPKDEPLVMIANHPYGIADGIAMMSIAERLERPYRILINKEILNVPEITPYSLPIDFAQTREAVAMNLKSRAQARDLLKEGVTIVVFPAGGVATAANPFGSAEELLWGTFTARIVQQARASVLPLYFEGQATPMFHAASRFSQSARLMMMVLQFRHFPGKTFKAHVGNVTPFASLPDSKDRQAITDEMYLLVHRLAPFAAGRTDQQIRPRSADERPNYPWDEGGIY